MPYESGRGFAPLEHSDLVVSEANQIQMTSHTYICAQTETAIELISIFPSTRGGPLEISQL